MGAVFGLASASPLPAGTAVSIDAVDGGWRIDLGPLGVLEADAGVATLPWDTEPPTTPDLILHATSPLMTWPDVA